MAFAPKLVSPTSFLCESAKKESNDRMFREDGMVGEKKKNKKYSLFRARKWKRSDVLYVAMVLIVHGLFLFAPFTFSWKAFWVFVIRYTQSGLLGVTLCYHRCLAHGSFKLPKPLEYLFAYFASLALQGEPIFWVSTHRYHHKVTDTEKDPHSPKEGFWYSHILWVFDKTYLEQKGRSYAIVSDLMKQSFYRFLKRTYGYHILFLLVSMYALGGFPYLVWGVGVTNTLGYHATFMVNSVCHIWGSRVWNTKDLSKNNGFVAMVSYGEGWHNNHHAFPSSARHGLEWWQIDMTWYVIRLLQLLGLATNVKLPSESQKKMMSIHKKTDGDVTVLDSDNLDAK